MIKVLTDHPHALESVDFRYPHGSVRDNSTNPHFNARLYELIPATQVRLLDLGCAGGGLVKSILDDGGFAVGLDGSIAPQARGLGEWTTIPGNLFCADITRPFRVETRSVKFGSYAHPQFNIVTAWEVLEHIKEADLPGVMMNVKQHLMFDGFFVGSINSQSYMQGHLEYHRTQRPKSWWVEMMATWGFKHAADLEAHFGDDLIRGQWRSEDDFSLALRFA